MTRLFVFILLVAGVWLFGRGVAWLTYLIDPDLRNDEIRWHIFIVVGFCVVAVPLLAWVLVGALWDLAGMVAE